MAGPTVFTDCHATNSYNDIGPHHRWATGILFDQVSGGLLTVEDRGNSGSGHGWSGGSIVYWNAEATEAANSNTNNAARIKVEAAPTTLSWAIGAVGPADVGTSGRSVWESYGRHVTPLSLYMAQKGLSPAPPTTPATPTPATPASTPTSTLDDEQTTPAPSPTATKTGIATYDSMTFSAWSSATTSQQDDFKTAFKTALVAALPATLGITSSDVAITSVTAGSVVVAYTVTVSAAMDSTLTSGLSNLVTDASPLALSGTAFVGADTAPTIAIVEPATRVGDASSATAAAFSSMVCAMAAHVILFVSY